MNLLHQSALKKLMNFKTKIAQNFKIRTNVLAPARPHDSLHSWKPPYPPVSCSNIPHLIAIGCSYSNLKQIMLIILKNILLCPHTSIFLRNLILKINIFRLIAISEVVQLPRKLMHLFL